jgi:hypothetical protein
MTLSPAMDTLTPGRLVTRSVLELESAIPDQVISNVRPPLIALTVTLYREAKGDIRNLLFRPLCLLGDVLDNVPVMIARAERHSGVMTGKILPQDLLCGAL